MGARDVKGPGNAFAIDIVVLTVVAWILDYYNDNDNDSG
jgi:hypothetical protein